MIIKPKSSFQLTHSPYLSADIDAAVCSVMTQKQPSSINTEAAVCPIISSFVESMVKGLQHKREKHTVKGFPKKTVNGKKSIDSQEQLDCSPSLWT